MSMLSMAIRYMFARSDKKRDAGLTTPKDIQRFDDIQYGNDAEWNVLDVYRPRGVESRLPVIVSVHGGGWVYGDKELYQYYCMSLAQHGFAVVNFTYRLAPKFKYPSSMVDTANVFRWVQANGEKYGLDTDNVFAVGDSAGAHMLGLFCCQCLDERLASTVGAEITRDLLPKGVALNCGVYKIEINKKNDLTARLMKDLLPNKGTAEELMMISVMDHLQPGFPPAFVMTAEGDFLKEQAKPLYEALRKLNVRSEYRYYGDRDHVLGHVFHCNMKLPEAARCNRDECDFFRRLIQQGDMK
ncbi:MAG: alpha/beta hydrolase [Erysipelotrichaceae bacterium]|nr:alpha/beta hydrolase [Erysipelotrichaceae bacterium]